MTTLPITLPLARHYYETRREVLAAGGEHVTPWYRLAPDEYAVAPNSLPTPPPLPSTPPPAGSTRSPTHPHPPPNCA